MDANDCTLSLCISYKEKSFTIQSENILTIDYIKEEIVKRFNQKEEDKMYMKLFLKNGEKEVFINSEDDIILNADDSDIDNPKLNLNLLIEEKKENKKDEKENKELNNLPEESTSSDQNENLDIKKIISENNLTPTPPTPKGEDDKYNELKNLIENLSSEIKVLKEDKINTKKNEDNNLNIKNEIEQCKKQINEIYNINNNNITMIKNEIHDTIKMYIKEEFNKIKEENQNKFKNFEELKILFNKKEKENEIFQSQLNQLKNLNENYFKNIIITSLKNNEEKIIKKIEEKYNEKINNLTEKISEQINKINILEEKLNKMNEANSLLQKNMNELINQNKNKNESYQKIESNDIKNDDLKTTRKDSNYNLFDSKNEVLINSTNFGLTLDESNNKDNNISNEESAKNNINNQNNNLNIEKINEIKKKFPQLKNYPDEKLQEKINNGENLDKVLPQLILGSSATPNK
jgi:hypothetical protein